MSRIQIAETLRVVEARPVEGKAGRFLIGLINPGWGSSGHYSAGVLQEAAKDKVFPAGTHMYLDHPTESETWERPERSVRDLAAVLTTDAAWDGEQLVAEAMVFGPHREVLAQMAESIGVSIRAAAEVTEGGEAEGRRGRIIDRLVQAESVDFVTKAGRGGRVLQVLESARAAVDEARNAGQWFESRLHQTFTNIADDLAGDGHLTREERISLSSAIGDALKAFAARVEADQPQLYHRDPFAEPDQLADVGESKDVTATRPDSTIPTTEADQEVTMGNIEIDEAEHARLVEQAGRVGALESERDTEKARAEAAAKALAEAQSKGRPSFKVVEEQNLTLQQENALLRAENHARTIIADELSEAWLGDSQKLRLGAELIKDLPLSESRELDETKLRNRCTEKINAAESEAAELLKAAGVGTPRGLGALATPATEAVSKQTADDLSESFKVLGLSESAAATAVKGR